MSDSDRTEFAQAWADDRDGQGQPGEGRAADDLKANGGDTGGAAEDAGKPASQADAPTTDAASPPAEVVENPDEFAELSVEELRARAKQLIADAAKEREARERAENTLRSNEGRYSRNERDLHELRTRLQQQQREEPKPEVPAISDDELRRIETEYDDLGPVFSQTVRALNAQIEELKKGSATAAEIHAKEAERDRERFIETQVASLTERHSDWMVVKDQPAYADWCNRQPEWVKDQIRRNGQALVDADAAAFVFDKFKADTAPVADAEEERRKRQLAGSAHIPARAPAFEASRASGTGGDYSTEWAAAAREEQQDRERQAKRGR